MKKKHISVLGSTGSIGRNTLKVAHRLKDEVSIVALAAKENIDLLEQQAKEHAPQLIAVYDKEKARLLQKRLPHIRVAGGMEGLVEAASMSDAEMVIGAMVGAAGLIPIVEAIKAGKQIGLANKEVLVSAGAYVMPLCKEKGVSLIPIDSEHNAIFQCLHGEALSSVRRIVVTGSGGPFRDWSEAELKNATIETALKHPNFSMGAKITIDSSTLMNKGLEVIEAYWLFGVKPEQIEVVIHPQQKIHSMVEFIDGSIMAQMSEPDMLLPIQHAMTYPKRYQGVLTPYDFLLHSRLDFMAPDTNRFRCLRLAYEALKQGGTWPCYMNAANEVLVNRFLNGEMRWIEIGERLETLMDKAVCPREVSLETVLAVDEMAREAAVLSE